MKLRVGYVIYGSLEQATGGYTYDRCLIAGLRDRGDEVSVISLVPGATRLAPELRACLRRSETDVVVADELCHREIAPLFGVSRALQSRGILVPARVLLVHHLTQWEDASRIATERRAVQRADIAIATSECNAQRLNEEFGVRASVCVPGADRLPFVPRRSPKVGPLRLLFVGTWTARKGLRELLLALLQEEQEFRLTIVGDAGRDAEYVASVSGLLVQHPFLAQRCEVLGVVTDERLSLIYAEHDVLVLPSAYEGYGMVLTEAARAGLGVVAFNTGGTPEAAAYASVAELVTSFGVAPLRAVLQRWIQQREAIRAKLGLAQAPAVAPSWGNTVHFFRAVLCETLGWQKRIEQGELSGVH